MSKAVTRVSEAEMAKVVAAILQKFPSGTATFAELRSEVPKHIRLSREDRREYESRPGEEQWHMTLRNLKSHRHEAFVSVRGGLRLKTFKRPKRHAVAKQAAAPAV